MSARTKDKSTVRAHLEAAAKLGDVSALAKLEEPECPESMEYLRDWAYGLHGRSGVGTAGLAPPSYREIDAWARLTGNDPDPLEVEALIVLGDALLSEGDTGEKDKETDQPAPTEMPPVPVWPTKKRAPPE
jgi:hypothetical protein